MTREGVLVIAAQRHRTQARNRQDALERLVDLVRGAAIEPRPHVPPAPLPPRASTASKSRNAALASSGCATANWRSISLSASQRWRGGPSETEPSIFIFPTTTNPKKPSSLL